MNDLVRFEKEGAIGVITVDNPPVNALSPGVPEGIQDSLAAGNADAEVKAMVLIGAGRTFIAGADIKHLGKPRKVRRPNQDVMEENDKPVVAAIHGFALGGGLENALGAHYRIAVASARVGLPEVLIGVLPGGGGTQRLPRLIGLEPALEIIVSGRHVPAPEARELGILDRVIDDGEDLRAAAIAFANEIADRRPLPRIREMTKHLEADAKAAFAAMRKKIARRARNQRAPYHCIACVEAAVALPFDQGLKRERELFMELNGGEEAKALQYAFFAERQANKVPGVDVKTASLDIAKAAVIGGGTMGSGIAMCFADAGIPVKLMEASPEALEKAVAKIRGTYEVSVQRGSLAAEALAPRIALITPVGDYADLGDVDVVIEAVFEDMAVKKQVFAKLDEHVRQGAVLATNSSALDIDEIASATVRPEAVIGTHFFSPANVMKLLEIVKGEQSSPDTIANMMKLAKRIGKVGVVCGNCDGFVANRSRAPFNVEMNILIEEGASPQQVDKAMVEFGYPMGPFGVADLAGGDIGHAGRKRREAANPNARKLPIADALVEMGRLGQKTGAGWYRYEKGDRTAHVDPEVTALIERMRRDIGINPRDFEDEEVLRRILFSSVNEACKILDEGIATRASDVDVMWLYGFGFPRYRGGLFHWADKIGPQAIYEQLRAWEAELGERWRPAKLLQDLAESGKAFADA